MGKCAIAGRECPRTNDPTAKVFCPAWSEGIVWTNPQSGEQRVKNCSFDVLMPALVQVIAASNRPAAAIESVRNELAVGLGGVAHAIAGLQQGAHELPMSGNGNKQIPKG